MRTRNAIAAALGAAWLTGCVLMPTSPMVGAMPGTQKNFDEFRADDVACRESAHLAVSAPAQATANTAAANTAASTALGAAAGAIIGGLAGDAGAGAAIGAGTGLFFGGAVASDYAASGSYRLQRDYDVSYLQCMYARGHRVPASFVTRAADRPVMPNYPPPNYPPPGSMSSSSLPFDTVRVYGPAPVTQ